MMPPAITAATAAPADSTVAKLAMMQRAIAGRGRSLTVTSMMTASMPSLPTTSGSRSRPAASGASEPNSTAWPSAVNPRTRSTLCKVRPYLRQWTPPEFSATLPPIVHAIWLDGSGA